MINRFLRRAITARHSVKEMESLLSEAGFTELKEEDKWSLEPGKGYYLNRSGRSMAAFRVGTAPLPQYRIIASHTDSPHLRLKMDSVTKEGTMLTGRTSVYGGPIMNTWLDRPLGLAGLVVVKKEGKTENLLFDSQEPIGLIPNAAIHLNREVNKGYEIKPQTHLPVMLNIHEDFRDYLAGKLNVEAENILSSQLELYLPDNPVIMGGDPALISSARIDNQIHCILTIQSLLESKDSTLLTPVGLFFDSEETGSRTMAGAHSSFAEHLLERISLSLGKDREDQLRSRSQSLILSADVAHGWNPNHADKYDPAYPCRINEGPVIKVNENNRYATTVETEGIIRLLAEPLEIPLQVFMIHSDLPCGSTVGPMMSADMSIPCVDMGIPIWAMHSICETAGMADIDNMGRLFTAFYKD
jgi:aspartyl aminopeptidase